MTLDKILAISKKPGLFKLISPSKNAYIVESLLDQKRTAVKIDRSLTLLGDISVYTLEEEIPLSQVFYSIYEKENGQKSSVDSKASKDDLEAYFFSILPNFDEDRVYSSDIKKIISWYNTLLNSGFDFQSLTNDD
jgi:hypothetical protein